MFPFYQKKILETIFGIPSTDTKFNHFISKCHPLSVESLTAAYGSVFGGELFELYLKSLVKKVAVGAGSQSLQ